MSEVVSLVNALAWPTVVLVVLWALSRPAGREFLANLFGRVSRLKAAGVEIELTAETSREVKAGLQETFRAFRDSARKVFDAQAYVEQIDVSLERVTQDAIKPALANGAPPFRVTVYVPDVLFEDVLYRLVDYYPAGGGRGTTYSTRYGIIGKSWRLQRSEMESVPPDPEQLIEKWGMTIAEATGQHRAKTLASVILRDDGEQPVGLLFLESEATNAFAEDLLEQLASAPAFRALGKAVDSATRAVREAGQPPLKIFDE